MDRTSRRAFLAGICGMPFLSSHTVDVEQARDGILVDVKGWRNDPLTLDEVNRIQRDAIDDYRKQYGNAPISVGEFRFRRDPAIMAFVYKIAPDGRSRYYIGGMYDRSRIPTTGETTTEEVAETTTTEEVAETTTTEETTTEAFERTTTETVEEPTTTTEETVTSEDIETTEGLVETTTEAADGTPGFVEDEVRNIHKTAREQRKRLAESMTATATETESRPETTRHESGWGYTGDIQDQSDEAWRFLTGGTLDVRKSPYGSVVSVVDVYHYDAGLDRNLLAARQNLNVYPGFTQFDTDEQWMNRRSIASHDWNQGYANRISLTAHEPAGLRNGSYRTSMFLGVRNVGLRWSYSQPNVRREDHSENPTAKWVWFWNEGHTNPAVFEVGSEAEASSNPSHGDAIIDVRSLSEFAKSRSERNTVRAVQRFAYE
ncbi:hypothetical protein [Halorussus aquaticus]|uniref:Uncharacterized protein n=1 Tax=Halorussus aquaticus TaxID=2953748 RepID=A0ABD5Q2F4_9EURY|nr:hypothetical protein [Halorussus aquaticus]